MKASEEELIIEVSKRLMVTLEELQKSTRQVEGFVDRTIICGKKTAIDERKL